MPLKRFLCILLAAAVIGFCVTVGVSSADRQADFAVVVLPDTQFYSQLHPDTYVSLNLLFYPGQASSLVPLTARACP